MKYLNIILVATLMVACKSSEQAYRNSYQKMVGAEGASAAKTETVVVTNADADGVRTERVKLVEGEGLKAYSIVCGSFSLKANAEYLIDDLRSQIEELKSTYQKRADFLMHQIELKDARMDEKDRLFREMWAELKGRTANE
jgi:uncharacterized protein YcfL